MARPPASADPDPHALARNAAITVAAAAPAATSGAAGALGVYTGARGARAVVDSAVKAISSVHVRLGTTRLARISDRLSAQGVAPDDLARALRRENSYEAEFRKRSAARTRAGLRLALAASDPSARAAGVEAVFRREQQYARQRAQASAERVSAAIEVEQLRRDSPLGAFWQLGHAAQHTPDCLAMAGKFWPWSVLNRIAPPLHVGCQCSLRSYGEALATGLMRAEDVPSDRGALRLAKPVIDFVERGHALESAAMEELELRVALLESRRADANVLAALPLGADFQLSEADGAGMGAMVALYPTPELAAQLAIPGGEAAAELHLTLAFMGNNLAGARREAALKAVRTWAKGCGPLKGEVSGTGQFVGGPKPVTYLSLDLPELPAQRERLVKALTTAGVPALSDHGYTPHITLDYASRRPRFTKAVPVEFDRVTLAWGGERISVPLASE